MIFRNKMTRYAKSLYNIKRTCHVFSRVYISMLIIPSAIVDVWHLKKSAILELFRIVGRSLLLGEMNQYLVHVF